LRGRPTVTSYIYDAQGLVAQAITASAWSDEDRRLMLAYREYLSTLCPGGCGQPREIAHHWDMDGWYEADAVTCHACTARKRAEQEDSSEPVKPVELIGVVDVRDYDKKPLPPAKTPATRARRR